MLATDRHLLAGHKGSRVGAQPQDGPRDLFRLAQALKRYCSNDGVFAGAVERCAIVASNAQDR